MVKEPKNTETRRFACTSCGRCCDLGPEMELGEATALADLLVTSVVFKAHSIPLDERSERAVQWWREQESRVPLRAAFTEKRRHLSLFASRRRSERKNGREVYLTISATTDDYGGNACPALAGGLCSIYDRRPVTCRTVPVHYSRQPSTLRNYLDSFTATPGYECDTTSSPVILDGSNVVSPELRANREHAVKLARADRAWKEHMLSIMDDPEVAQRSELPQLITPGELESLCGKQLRLIQGEIERSNSSDALRELIPLYEAGAAGRGRLTSAAGLIFSTIT